MLQTLPDQHPTWALKRFRRLHARHQQDEVRLSQIAVRCTLTDQHLQYQGRVTAVRPTTALLLRTLWDDVTRSRPIHEVTAALYGKPSTLRSVRQIVFRANRDFERIDCPLIIHCRALYVIVQYRPPRFLQAMPMLSDGRLLNTLHA